jgi:hypothetical protein
MGKYFGSALRAAIFILQPFHQAISVKNMLAWAFECLIASFYVLFAY